MKNICLFLLIILSISCTLKSTKITVENSLDFDRNGEIVEVAIAALNLDINKTYILKNATSNKGVPQGQTYIGVYLPDATGEPFIEDGNYAIRCDYKQGDEQTYYFGGGWSKWKFPMEQDWLTALAQFSRAKQAPLKVTVSQ